MGYRREKKERSILGEGIQKEGWLVSQTVELGGRRTGGTQNLDPLEQVSFLAKGLFHRRDAVAKYLMRGVSFTPTSSADRSYYVAVRCLLHRTKLVEALSSWSSCFVHLSYFERTPDLAPG